MREKPKLIVNIDSLPLKRFEIDLFVPDNYKIVNNETTKIRPTFSFLSEFLTGKPPSKTKIWVDYVISKSSPYWFLKWVKDFKVKDRNPILRKILMTISKIISKETYNPQNIPLGLLPFFDIDKNLKHFRENVNKLFKEKFGTKSVSIISGDIYEVELGIRRSKQKLVFANYSILDYVGHIFGPNSREYAEYTKKVFRSIREVLSIGKFEEVQIMNDHGMYEIKKYIEIEPLLQEFKIGKDLIFFINSPMLRFWILNKEVEKDLLDRLEEIKKWGKILEKKDYERFSFPKNRRFGEIIFWLHKGYHFLPDFFWGWKKIKGMHGYLEFERGKKITLKLLD